MTKFCTKCGKKLEDGQVCDCNTKIENTSSTFDIKECATDYLEIIKGIFIHPATTIKKYSQENKCILGIIALIINCLVSGFLFYFLCDKALNGIMSLFMGGYSSLLSSSYSIPFFRCFLMGLLFMVFWFLVCAFVILLFANPIFKSKINIKNVFALLGSCSVFTTLTSIFAIICSFISVPFTIAVLFISAGFYLTYLYQGLSDITNLNKNKLVYVFMPAITAATFVMVYIVPKFFK